MPSSSLTDSAKVRAYLAALPPGVRKRVKLLRRTIRAAAPAATEAFSYGIPAFRIDGRLALWYAGWKQHTSIYPLTAAMKRGLARELKGRPIAKGTLRFPLTEPMPVGLVRRLVKARVAELRKATRKQRAGT